MISIVVVGDGLRTDGIIKPTIMKVLAVVTEPSEESYHRQTTVTCHEQYTLQYNNAAVSSLIEGTH